jgi:DNA-binding transcriptional regulator YdaS (Cro superfamily)
MERGLLSLVARSLGVTRGAVAKWRHVPAERVLAVEKCTGIPRERLRPDLYKPRRR